MFSKFDKAGAAVLGSSLGAAFGHFLGWDPEQTAALVTVINAALVFLVPNKAVKA